MELRGGCDLRHHTAAPGNRWSSGNMRSIVTGRMDGYWDAPETVPISATVDSQSTT